MKIRFTILLIAVAMILASCGQPVSQNAGTAAGTFGEKDLVFVLNGTEYPLDSDVAPLLEALGPDYEPDAAISCVYSGDDKWFYYPDKENSEIMIATNPIDGKDLFYLIEIYGGEYATAKGIKIGSTLEEVKAAYGSGGFDVDSTYIYYLSGNKNDITSKQLCFEYDEAGKVTVISYYDPSTNIKK